MMILIAGPYRGGTNDDPILIKKNLDNLESVAGPVSRTYTLLQLSTSLELLE